MRIALVFAAVAACSSPKPAPPPLRPEPAPVAEKQPAKPAEPKAPTFDGVPDTLAGKELAWFLDAIVNRKGVVERAEVERRFDQKFLAAIPPDKAVATFAMLGGQLNKLALKSVKGDDMHLVARVEVENQKLMVLLDLDPGSKRIVGLLLKPDAEAGPKPKSFEEALTLTAGLAPKAQLLVASLDKNGTCKPVHATKSKDQLAIGSTFKLYVLLGLVDRIIAGKAKWDDELAVRDDWKSLPSGITQNDAAGTKLTLREHATRMISISDNTATDHLLYYLGRNAVEAAMRSTKHANPKLNVPFFGTRELFVFKLGLTDAEIEDYKKLKEPKRREFLDKLAGKTPELAKAADWQTARRIDELEWFAHPDDLCRAMGTLWKRAQKAPGKDLLDVLGKNPGVEIDKTKWPYIGFKGGSEPGVINLTWLLRRADDQWFVVVLTANAREGVVDDAKAVGVASGVLELLGAAK